VKRATMWFILATFGLLAVASSASGGMEIQAVRKMGGG